MIELTDWLTAELTRRAASDAPEECCGLISRATDPGRVGRDGIALWAAENASQSPTDSFMIAPASQFGILREIKKRREELAGVYHSHPHSGPEPSQRDREIAAVLSAFAVDLTWVIVGFPGGDDSAPDYSDAPEFWVGTLP